MSHSLLNPEMPATASEPIQPPTDGNRKQTARAGQPKRAYKVVASSSIVDLEKEVEIYLNDGWRVAGGIATGSIERNKIHPNAVGTYQMYYQAIVSRL